MPGGGVIDEFLIKIGMEGDSSGLVDAYKEIFRLQDEYTQKQNESEGQESQSDDKKQKRGAALAKLQGGVNAAVSKGVELGKRGVGMARNWAVALLAVDGAAMAVIGRLSQMAVEYDNTAGSINMAASEMKAWEDTLKSAGGKAEDVQSSLQSVYEKSFKAIMGEGEAGFQTAIAAFGVQTSEGGELRNAGDIFSDIIEGFRTAIETGMDPDLARGYLEQAGVSRQLAEPILRQDDTGGYIASAETFAKFLAKSASLDELADASSGLTQIITELSATFRDKFARVLTKLVESGVLERMLTQLTEFVDNIDVEKVAETIAKFIEAMEIVFGWVGEKLGGVKEVGSGLVEFGGQMSEARQQKLRRDALVDAIKESMGGEYGEFGSMFGGSAKAYGSPGGFRITEEEALSKATDLGLNLQQIFSQAGLQVTNDIKVLIDGKNIPATVEYGQNGGRTNASNVDSGLTQ